MKQFNEADLTKMITALDADKQHCLELKSYFKSRQRYVYSQKIQDDAGLFEAEIDKISDCDQKSSCKDH